jgi:hypothetical protein
MHSLELSSCPIAFGSGSNSTDRCVFIRNQKISKENGWVLTEILHRAQKSPDADAKFDAQ